MQQNELLFLFLKERQKFDELLQEANSYPQYSIIRHISLQSLISQTKVSHFYFKIIDNLFKNFPLENRIVAVWSHLKFKETINIDKDADYYDKLAFYDIFIIPNLEILFENGCYITDTSHDSDDEIIYPPKDRKKKLKNIVKFLKRTFYNIKDNNQI